VFVAARSESEGPSGATTAEYSRELGEAIEALGLDVWVHGDHVVADGTAITLPVTERAHPHPGVVAGLVADHEYPGLMVADRLSESARQVLRDAGWSWLDRRGHMRLWLPGLRIDAPIGLGQDTRSAVTSPWTPVGLEIALHALLHPQLEVSARSVARDTGRAATLGGAPIAAAADLPTRCYAPKAAVRRLRPHSRTDEPARTWVRLAPVTWIPELAGFEPDEAHPWRIAHPIVCALRLATDEARGREIVEDWGVVPE